MILTKHMLDEMKQLVEIQSTDVIKWSKRVLCDPTFFFYPEDKYSPGNSIKKIRELGIVK